MFGRRILGGQPDGFKLVLGYQVLVPDTLHTSTIRHCLVESLPTTLNFSALHFRILYIY